MSIYSDELIDRLVAPTGFSDVELEKKYPVRQITGGQLVMRFAPSPTGFVHIGAIFSALLTERAARQSGGIMILRIEDTDQKREMEGGINLIIDVLDKFGIHYDEGLQKNGEIIGDYGPYIQSERKSIYQTYVRLLLKKGLAYPSFDSPEELEEMRKNQEKIKARTGYYASFAVWRNKSVEEVEKALDDGKVPVIRFRSSGNFNSKFSFIDVIKGKLEMAENDQDVVILKSDNLPTYHLAHVVDDHLMRTNLVTRGEEWIPSTSIHVQLFSALDWEIPKYAHFSVISKLDNGNKRKLSKRKDPEANMEFYDQQGFSKEAVLEYLMNLINSHFANWRTENPDAPLSAYQMEMDNISKSSPLFDEKKLLDVSKQIIARMSAEEILERMLIWTKKYDPEFGKKLEKEKDYVLNILNIERENRNSPHGGISRRKDIAKWSDVKNSIDYFFDDWFFIADIDLKKMLQENIDLEDAKKTVDKFLLVYDEKDSKEIWLKKVKNICKELSYAENVKEYKANPDAFKGNLANIAGALRILLTGRTFSPDLFEIMQVMGKERIENRLKKIENL